MNSRPMILRFSSGSTIPSSDPRNWSLASTTSRVSKTASKSRRTCSVSPRRIIPWSTYTQVSRSPMARCTMAAATAESTPPERAQIARPSPIWARMASTCSSTMLSIVQVGRQPAISSRKCSSTRCPCSVCSTSGCHWTPAKPRSTSSNAATGVPPVEASRVKPSGAAVTESPWDIQTLCCSGMPASRVPDSTTLTGVRPYSRAPVGETVPPSDWAMIWKP